jgi:hypothetical protein
MAITAQTSARPPRVMRSVRQRIERGGERLWRLEDFRDLPFLAVAQALSRLTREGLIERLSKGIYYRNRETAFGKSKPNPASIRNLASQRKALFPSGLAAANLLGFTTQMPKQGEPATSALSLPRKSGSLGYSLGNRCRFPGFLTAWSKIQRIAPGRDHPQAVGYFVRTRTFEPTFESCRFRTSTCSGDARRPCRATRHESFSLAASTNVFKSAFPVRVRDAQSAAQRQCLASQGEALALRLFEHPDFEQAILRASEHFR